MNEAQDAIRRTLSELRAFLAQESVPRLSEADTKAYFVEPIIAALGWVGIGVVRREYYVKNSQEFIDYVLFDTSDHDPNMRPVLAIESKALQVDLTEKNAAQLIQYCAVEGIEWAALTNARELQFFNTFLKPDLDAKRVMRLDLLAFNSDEEYDELFSQLWQLSRESITTARVRTWLNQVRLDSAVRQAVLTPGSTTLDHLRQVLAAAEVNATSQELAQWFRLRLASPVPAARTVVTVDPTVPDPPPISVRRVRPSIQRIPDRKPATRAGSSKQFYGVRLGDLMAAGFLAAGTPLVLTHSGRDVARAELTAAGDILWQGERFRSLSDRSFAELLGRTSLNGWIHWYAEVSGRRVVLAGVREQYLAELEKSTFRIGDAS